jgi:hypothetical protein
MKSRNGRLSKLEPYSEIPAAAHGRSRAQGQEVRETMGTEIKVPMIVGAKLSIGRWFKRVGDPVSIDEREKMRDSISGTPAAWNVIATIVNDSELSLAFTTMFGVHIVG